MLTREDAVLAVVDVQGKLAQLMPEKVALFRALQQMISGSQLLDIPILWLEQVPEKLGPTIDELVELMPGQTPLTKSSFSSMGCAEFRQQLAASGRRQVLLTGIEAHICVYQTARDLLAEGYEVHLVTDAVASRHPDNKALAITKLLGMGAELTGVEMALFELQQVAEGDRFRTLSRLIK